MDDGGGVRSGYPHYRVFAAAEENGAARAVPVAKLKPWPRLASLEARVFAVEKNKIYTWLGETTIEGIVPAAGTTP